MSRTAIFPMNMARVCVDEYQSDLSGRAYSKLMMAPLVFSGCCMLLLKLDHLFDQVGYPQALQVRRSFSEEADLRGSRGMPQQMMKDAELEKQSGNRRTFDIIVQSRNQSGWQGLLMNPDRTRVKKFRSELELLNSICSEMEQEP